MALWGDKRYTAPLIHRLQSVYWFMCATCKAKHLSNKKSYFLLWSAVSRHLPFIVISVLQSNTSCFSLITVGCLTGFEVKIKDIPETELPLCFLEESEDFCTNSQRQKKSTIFGNVFFFLDFEM